MRITHWLVAGTMAALFAGLPITANASKPIGRITAAFGQATIEGPSGTRTGDLHSTIGNDEKIVTSGAGVTVLLASRVVLKIDADSAVVVTESPDQTHIVLEQGTVHVFVGQRPNPSAIVTLQDPLVRLETRTGVVLASYDPRTNQGYYACEHNSVQMEPSHRVETFIEPRTLTADTQVLASAHLFSQVEPLDRQEFNRRKQSLDRLVHSTRAQGSNAFRVRARAYDTEMAISSLAAAGWIDKNAVIQPNPTLVRQPTASAGTSASTPSAGTSAPPQQASATVPPTPPSTPPAPVTPPSADSIAPTPDPTSPPVPPATPPVELVPPPMDGVTPQPPPVEIVMPPPAVDPMPDPVIDLPVTPPPIEVPPVVPPIIVEPPVVVPPIDVAPDLPPVVEPPVAPPIDIAPITPPVIDVPVVPPPIDIVPDVPPVIDTPPPPIDIAPITPSVMDVPVVPPIDIAPDIPPVIDTPPPPPIDLAPTIDPPQAALPVVPDITPPIQIPDVPPALPTPEPDLTVPINPPPTDPVVP